MKRQTFIWFILICIPLILLSYDLLGKKESKKDLESEKEERRKQQKSDNIKDQLLSRYDTWELPPDILYKKKYYIYTYGLQKLVIHENKKPILFEGFLEDITRKEIIL